MVVPAFIVELLEDKKRRRAPLPPPWCGLGAAQELRYISAFLKPCSIFDHQRVACFASAGSSRPAYARPRHTSSSYQDAWVSKQNREPERRHVLHQKQKQHIAGKGLRFGKKSK